MAATDPAPQLVQLSQTEAFGLFDHHQGRIGHIDSDLDHRGCNQQLRAAASDEHAARVLRELMARRPGLRVCALGGPRLAAAGAQLLQDLTAGSAMGFAVVAKIAHYKKLIADIVEWTGRHRPRAVCFVDSSGLNLRIASGLNQPTTGS